MKKGIIFDLDGTLINTISDLDDAVNLTYQELNIDKHDDIDLTMKRVGHGIHNLIEQCFVEYPDLIEVAYKTFLIKYDEVYDKTSTPYPNMKELIDTLIKNNIKVGVNSNKNDNYTKRLIELHFPNINQEYVLGHVDSMKVKPDPDGVNYIIDKMNLEKDDVVYVGDSLTDVETAHNAHLSCLSVTWGFRNKDELIDHDNILVDEPKDILKYL